MIPLTSLKHSYLFTGITRPTARRIQTYSTAMPLNVTFWKGAVIRYHNVSETTIRLCMAIILWSSTMCESLTMPARASSVVWTWVMFPFSNRSLASNMSFGFKPYARMALMKLPRFSSYINKQPKKKKGFNAMLLHTKHVMVRDLLWFEL